MKKKSIKIVFIVLFVCSFFIVPKTLGIYRETKNKSVNFTVEHPSFTVSFSVNGGSGGQSSNIDATYGHDMPILSGSVPTMTDYVFLGYFDAPSGGTKYYNADLTSAHTFDKTSDTILYAQWEHKCAAFTNDSWSDIVDNVQDGDYSRYPVGCTKEVTLGNSLGTHTLRVANNSNYDCTLNSQTACGFVLEFADIITTHDMNSTWTNDGSWPASELRTYLNDEDDLTSIINSLPTVLKNGIIDTTVMSGHGSVDGGDTSEKGNFISTDKLYLLSNVEIYGTTLTYDTLKTSTRQMDYYGDLNVTLSNYTGAIKKESSNASSWWLRSPFAGSTSVFYIVSTSGGSGGGSDAHHLNGVSPAFRLAGPASLTYNINYIMNGGEKGNRGPNKAISDVVFEVSKPTKTFTVEIDSNTQGATLSSNSASSSQVFAGWSANNLDVANAKYGTSSDNVTTSWNSSSTKVGANENTMYFKNLAQAGNIVTLVANWTPTAVTLPTVTKTGYTCSFNTAADGTGILYNGGASYTPSATEGSMTLYVRCSPNIYAITLDNQSATTAGTTMIYEKYDNGYYLNNTATTQMTTNSNGITIPVRTNYIFGGYYTETNGSGTQYIDEDGYITRDARNNNFVENGSLYAYWVTCGAFSTDNWQTIATCTKIGYTGYNVGDTKEIEMGNNLGTHTLRVVNNSNYNCTLDSQTACGFVVEFADIITTHNMNSEYSNLGGWSSSEMRTYLNDENNSSSIYNLLPSELKSRIIDTIVVSGHGSTLGETNFISRDKLYLLSPHEVVEDLSTSGFSFYDTSYSHLRQLDYYSNIGVTSSSGSGAIKKYNNSATNWWLRSALSNSDVPFWSITSSGNVNASQANSIYGVSPAFRLAGPAANELVTITYDEQNGNAIKSEIVIQGNESILPTPVKCEYTFDGWYTAATGGSKIGDGGDSYIATSNITLYAHWVISNFAADSLSTIISNVHGANASRYSVGDTRKIELGNDLGTYCIRVSNNSNYNCTLDSQTACGFVVEFVDVISNSKMNNTLTNAGGWSDSLARTYLNDTIYNALPVDLKNGIIDTTVVSGHGSPVGETNSASNDKLYLLSTHEIFEDDDGNLNSGIDYYDTAYNDTRQLDYYSSIGVTSSSVYKVIKNYNGSIAIWWIRSANFNSKDSFFAANTASNQVNSFQATNSYGISPAFRLSGPSAKSLITVTYDAQDYSATTKKAVIPGKNVILPTMSKCGYTFNGWYDAASGGNKIGNGGASYTPIANITLYAQWTSSNFNDDPWSTIVSNVQGGNVARYSVGSEKSVTLGNNLGTHCVRVVNNSNYDCTLDSKTACGFVLEFADIIINKKFNNTNTSVGGWESSAMRTYLNNANDSTSIYNSLPSELKAGIIDTTVVSGYEQGKSSNYTTTDKLYLPSYVEVYGGNYQNDTVTTSHTRQLDYYQRQGVTTNNGTGAIKKNSNGVASIWWLRSTFKTNKTSFLVAGSSGTVNAYGATYTEGVSPVFRLETNPNLIVVNYDFQDDSAITAQTIVQGESLLLPTPNMCGYTFSGWYDAASGGNKIGDGGDSYTPIANITLYAQWTPLSNFAADSWSTIVSNTQSGNTSRYSVGDERSIYLGNSLGTHCIRVANNSNYGCSKLSKTACGFVLEFSDIITKYDMNGNNDYEHPIEDYEGGWGTSEMRTYINGTIYNSLPTDLKSGILQTQVAYGRDSEVATTNDYLYLLSTVEINSSQSDDLLTTTQTRTLDYYENATNSTRIKRDINNASYLYEWWLRSQRYNNMGSPDFYCVSSSGGLTYNYFGTNGVSPAFRLKG